MHLSFLSDYIVKSDNNVVKMLHAPLWIVIVNSGEVIKIDGPEVNKKKSPVIVALLQWETNDGASGHYQALKPQPCNCQTTWASRKCMLCQQPLCQACECNCKQSFVNEISTEEENVRGQDCLLEEREVQGTAEVEDIRCREGDETQELNCQQEYIKRLGKVLKKMKIRGAKLGINRYSFVTIET